MTFDVKIRTDEETTVRGLTFGQATALAHALCNTGAKVTVKGYRDNTPTYFRYDRQHNRLEELARP